MAKTYYLKIPLKASDFETLEIGDKVLLTGTIYTARDAAHKRLCELISNKESLPFDPEGAVIFYVGPAPAPPGKTIGSAGPTTSYRMDHYTPQLLDAGVNAMIGKGPRSKEVIESIVKNRAIYLAAIGGAAVVIADSVKESEIIAYDDLGPEAIRKLWVEDLPCIVAIDIHGNDIFKQAIEKYRQD